MLQHAAQTTQQSRQVGNSHSLAGYVRAACTSYSLRRNESERKLDNSNLCAVL